MRNRKNSLVAGGVAPGPPVMFPPPVWPNPGHTTAFGGGNFLNRPGRQNLWLRHCIRSKAISMQLLRLQTEQPGLGKIDCNRYSIAILLFVHRMHWSLLFF